MSHIHEFAKTKIHEFVNYRYENGILNPDMGSVFIALDPSVKANGCLQVFLFSITCALIVIAA